MHINQGHMERNYVICIPIKDVWLSIMLFLYQLFHLHINWGLGEVSPTSGIKYLGTWPWLHSPPSDLLTTLARAFQTMYPNQTSQKSTLILFSKWSPSIGSPHQNHVRTSPLPHTRQMSLPSHYSSSHHLHMLRSTNGLIQNFTYLCLHL